MVNLSNIGEAFLLMNYIWAGMIIFSFFAAAAKGNMQALSDSVLSGGQDAVNLCIKLLGVLCLWGGLMRIAEKSGLTSIISKALSPLIRIIFPKIDINSSAAHAISMNMTANLLGLGNAATPLGINAIKHLAQRNYNPLTASNEMVRFVVINSAALHIIPTTVAMLRQEYGSASPMEIMPATWLTSIAALTVGLLVAKLMEPFTLNSD